MIPLCPPYLTLTNIIAEHHEDPREQRSPEQQRTGRHVRSCRCHRIDSQKPRLCPHIGCAKRSQGCQPLPIIDRKPCPALLPSPSLIFDSQVTDQPAERPYDGPIKPEKRQRHVYLSLTTPSQSQASDTIALVKGLFSFIDFLEGNKLVLRPEVSHPGVLLLDCLRLIGKSTDCSQAQGRQRGTRQGAFERCQ